MSIVLRIVALIAGLLVASAGCGTKNQYQAGPIPPLVDSLSTVYGTLQEAASTDNPDEFFACLDPIEAYHVKKLASSNGYRKVKSFIERRYAFLPDLDTLNFREWKRAGDYVRLTYVGPGGSFGYNRERARFSFLLFRSCTQGWKLSAISSIEKDRFDRYGYELTYHETDLPPKFRFPRIL
jgi:hypothetical protein